MGRPLTHGETVNGIESPEYKAWCAMNARCSNSNDRSYERYGGRGIAVCARWRRSFPAFLSDMGRRPGPGWSIDRIDNDDGYSKKNCRWATNRQQALNTSRNRLLTWNGMTMTVSEWSVETNISSKALESRLRLGWTHARTLSTPPQGGWAGAAATGKDRKTHCANGHEYTPENTGRNGAGWRFCRACGRERSLNYMRAKRGRKKK